MEHGVRHALWVHLAHLREGGSFRALSICIQAPSRCRNTGRSSGRSSPLTPHNLTGPSPASESVRDTLAWQMWRRTQLRLVASSVRCVTIVCGLGSSLLPPYLLRRNTAGLSHAETWSKAHVGAGEAQRLFCV